MIYTIENTSAIGKPVKVFDGNGHEVLYPRMVNTETGECFVSTVDEGGQLVTDPKTGDLATHTEYRPLPLKIEPINIGEE